MSQIVVYHTFFIPRQNVIKWVVCVVQKNRRSNFISVHFFVQFVRHTFFKLLWFFFFNSIQMFRNSSSAYIYPLQSLELLCEDLLPPKSSRYYRQWQNICDLLYLQEWVHQDSFFTWILHCALINTSLAPNVINVSIHFCCTVSNFKLIEINLVKVLFWHLNFKDLKIGNVPKGLQPLVMIK